MFKLITLSVVYPFWLSDDLGSLTLNDTWHLNYLVELMINMFFKK
jgi:hypothetical protein